MAEEHEDEEEEQLGMEKIPNEGQLLVEDEIHSRRSPVSHSPFDVRETFSKLVECSRNNQGNAEIIDMLVTTKKEMEEREKS